LGRMPAINQSTGCGIPTGLPIGTFTVEPRVLRATLFVQEGTLNPRDGEERREQRKARPQLDRIPNNVSTAGPVGRGARRRSLCAARTGMLVFAAARRARISCAWAPATSQVRGGPRCQPSCTCGAVRARGGCPGRPHSGCPSTRWVAAGRHAERSPPHQGHTDMPVLVVALARHLEDECPAERVGSLPSAGSPTPTFRHLGSSQTGTKGSAERMLSR